MKPLVDSELESASETLDVLEVLEFPAERIPSYHKTPIHALNVCLEKVDVITRGRAGLLQRMSSFVVIGGLAALVNLIVYNFVLHGIALPVGKTTHGIIAFIVASEISLLANFVPNDYFTFRHMSGHERSWLVRLFRFHITASSGILVTFLINSGLTYLIGVPALVAQAIALILAMFYNFSAHHFFTYRGKKKAASELA